MNNDGRSSGVTESGVWSMEYGVWSQEYGVWSMEYGVWLTPRYAIRKKKEGRRI
jgi:hypothetical protein